MDKMKGSGYVASFIGHSPGKAQFVGIYSINGSKKITRKQYWNMQAYKELKKYSMEGYTIKDPRPSIYWFELELTEYYLDWKGKLIINWPPPELSWWRRAHKNTIPIHAIHEESILVESIPKWDEKIFTWDELSVIPSSWKNALAQWRGIYFIFDVSDSKGYVGSAYGKENIYGRWLGYSITGHGGNKFLKKRDPKNFRFSILQRVSPDLEPDKVIQIENTWKERLHTREYGLNDN